MTWHPKWHGLAAAEAQAHGWALIEQADGKLAFVSSDGKTKAPIISTGNDEGAPEAIRLASNAMQLQSSLTKATDRITAAVPIARAIVDGRKAMGLAEKMATLAQRAQSVPKALEAKADALLPRLDALEASGGAAFEGLANVVADAEEGVAAAEAAMRLLTNGAPLSASSGSQKGG